MLIALEEWIHYSDLAFTHLCYEKYGINRGVYNTIDTWLYNQGIINILERRRALLAFLESLKGKMERENPRQKFGNGGLKIKLQEYFLVKDESAALTP